MDPGPRPYLEVDDHKEDEDRREDVVDVGETGPLEGILERVYLVGCLDEGVEEVNDGTFILIGVGGPHGDRRKALPEEGLTDIGGNE